MAENKTGLLIIISGPSGAGKSTICKKVIEQLDNLYLNVSATTRQQTEQEIDGENYWFMTETEFQKNIENDMFLEYAKVFGNWYGSPKNKVTQMLQQGKNVILEIDVQGAQKAKKLYEQAVTIFILPPSDGVLAKRLGDRARDDKKTIEKRLAESAKEIAMAKQIYDNQVVNDDLTQAVSEVVDIIKKAGEKL